ncbi:hypothetical protein EVAR_22987_1 [Eumeta japonica]|uniref:Uncharacterized protein n=1 Tax=Eumeta variegata TaxID=151549 RepID=A0A4C1UPY3_EUMVA|nr:hypothetical protein EVAR_22987_1 [Eumeta japonica]
MGGIQYPHLNDLAREIWQYCEEKNLFIFASYIASKDNYLADKKSRKNAAVYFRICRSASRRITTDIKRGLCTDRRRCKRFPRRPPEAGAARARGPPPIAASPIAASPIAASSIADAETSSNVYFRISIRPAYVCSAPANGDFVYHSERSVSKISKN